jgi:4-hydroxybenzoyl-CoA reductase subunit beta
LRLPRFEYHGPNSIDEASRLLSTYGNDAVLCGGGTDLFVRMKERLATPSHIIALANLPNIREISYDPLAGLELGTGVTLSALIGSSVILANYPAIAATASLVATRQVRNMATLGGNILQNTRCCYYNRSAEWRKTVTPCFKRGGEFCHVLEKGNRCFAVYQGDLAPLILSLRGTATLVSEGGAEEQALEDLFSGDGRSPFQKFGNKILTKIRIPIPPHNTYSAYKKFRLRKGMDFPLAGAAVALSFNGETINDVRICLTGVSSAPVLIKETKELALGKGLAPDLIGELARRAYTSAHPVANVEDSPSHRRSMVRILVEEILEGAAKG